jgi:dienelactone hydrolase
VAALKRIALVVLAACTRAPQIAPSNSARIASGVLVPSELDKDVAPVTTASGGDARHYYCTPTTTAGWNGQLVIYIVGAREDPGLAHAFADRACTRGYAAIAPAYRNERPIRGMCGDDARCYGPVRHEIVFGDDAAKQIVVDQPNAMLHRIDTIASHLATAFPAVWAPLRERLRERDFSRVVLAGFSQGSGHALILAHDFEFTRVIQMSGVLDRIGSGTEAHAPVTWISTWTATQPKTPGTRLFALNHADDPFTRPAELAANYAALGLPDATCEVTEEPPAGECHRFVIHTAACADRTDGHVTPSVASFGTDSAPCAPGGPLRHLGPTWDYLLGAH